MITLCIRTDKPTAQLRLYSDSELLAELNWEAHRLLAETVHKKIDEILTANSFNLRSISKVVVYEGPGSFTGLRIGIAVANSLAFGLGVPVTASAGDQWAVEGVLQDSNFTWARPVYGQDPHITKQKK